MIDQFREEVGKGERILFSLSLVSITLACGTHVRNSEAGCDSKQRPALEWSIITSIFQNPI